jgi:hypothetical protein
MLKDTQILKSVNSNNRVIIKDYINGWIVADDTAENLLNENIYNQNYDVYKIGVERGCLLLEIRDE